MGGGGRWEGGENSEVGGGGRCLYRDAGRRRVELARSWKRYLGASAEMPNKFMELLRLPRVARFATPHRV